MLMLATRNAAPYDLRLLWLDQSDGSPHRSPPLHPVPPERVEPFYPPAIHLRQLRMQHNVKFGSLDGRPSTMRSRSAFSSDKRAFIAGS